MKQGKRIATLRKVTLAAVFVAVLASLAFDLGLGTPSSFGIGEFFLLCPLGGIEAMIASKTFIPAAAISIGVILVFALIFGRAWCAWGCPAPRIRSFFKRQPEGAPLMTAKEMGINNQPLHTSSPNTDSASPNIDSASPHTDSASPHTDSASPHTSHLSPHEVGSSRVQAGAKALGQDDSQDQKPKPSPFRTIINYIANDRRLWVLAGALLVTFIIGFPIFCLVCPIGLTFGTVSSLWHLIVDKQLTASVIVFPLALVVELIIYRKWCVNLCPIAGLLNVFGQFAKLFRPRVDASTCLLYNTNKKCNACTHVCAENINMHEQDAARQLGECTRCGECAKHCPTDSITIKAKPSDPVLK